MWHHTASDTHPENDVGYIVLRVTRRTARQPVP